MECSKSHPFFFRHQNPNIDLLKYQPEFPEDESYLQAVLVQLSLSDLWTHFPHIRDNQWQTLRATANDSGCPLAVILQSVNK